VSRGGPVREEGWYLLETLALTGFLVTQPVLDTFGNSPETFIAHGAGRSQIIGFAIAVAALPALAVWAIALATRLAGAPRRRIAHLAAVGILLGLLAEHIADNILGPPRAALVAIGLAAGIGAVLAYGRTTWARLYLRVASAAPVVFAALFVLASPTADLVRGPTVSAARVDVPAAAPSVLFIVLDMLPTASLLDGHGRIDAGLYPSFARLASESTWYRNQTTVAPWTNMAIPAILTGNLPLSQDTAPVASLYPHNLFTLLGASYDLGVTEPITALCPSTLCGRSGGGLGALLGDATDVARDAGTPEQSPFGLTVGLDAGRPDRFDRFVDSIPAAGGRPRLDYVHVLLPHDPWSLLPNGVAYPAPEHPIGMFFADWAGEHAVAVGRQRQLLQVQLTDRLVGKALDRLEETGRYDDTLVVVTADHGVAFTDQEPWRGASAANFEQIMWTPLLVKAPHQTEGRIDDRNVWSVDILPTLADMLDIRIPKRWELLGRSLAGRAEVRDRSDKVLFDWKVNTLEPGADGLVHVDGEEGFDRLLHWSAAPPGNDDLRVWRQGEYGSLVGTRPDDHRMGAPTTYEGWLADPGAYTDVDLEHDPPVHLDGAFVGADPGAAIAVAVNGVIGGWGPTVATITEHSSNFWTLIAYPLLHPGENDLRFYAISGPADDVTLSPVPMRDG